MNGTSKRVPLSVLDLAPISQGMSRKQALDEALELAKTADSCGYYRYWMAEHHGSVVFMSSATSVLLTRALEHTETIRIGAGGVMLPNHSPLMVAEYYGTLATIYGNRIDLSLGRAPGTDPATASKLRRGSAELSAFTGDVTEVYNYLEKPNKNVTDTLSGAETAILGLAYHPQVAREDVRAIPGEGTRVPLWILGSSTGGARVAADLGLPFSFASHFAAANLPTALDVYRKGFHTNAATAQVDKPYVQACVNVFCAPTEDEARLLATSAIQLKNQIGRGMPGQLQEPTDLLAEITYQLDAFNVLGTPSQVVKQLEDLVKEYGIDEFMVVSNIFNPSDRRRSYELLSEAWM